MKKPIMPDDVIAGYKPVVPRKRSYMVLCDLAYVGITMLYLTLLYKFIRWVP